MLPPTMEEDWYGIGSLTSRKQSMTSLRLLISMAAMLSTGIIELVVSEIWARWIRAFKILTKP